MDSYQEFKKFYYSTFILFIVILYVVIYIIINWENISNGNYWSGEIVKPILITGILFLITHMILTWDDENTPPQNEIVLPKYKLGQNDNQAKNEIIAANTNLLTQSLNNKYRIVNKFDTPHYLNNPNPISNPTLEQFGKIGQNLSHSDNNKLSNQNIFISQKNSSKYGIKFI